MSEETALYFPYIKVPQTPWFSQVLLYWDRAAVIVPHMLRNSDTHISPYMRELASAGLLKMMDPDEGKGSIDRDRFDSTFLDLVDAYNAPVDGRKFAQLHMAKMSPAMSQELRARGLVRDYDHNPEWWYVEKGVADLYMAYLASAISAAAPGTFPITDGPEPISTLAPIDSSGTDSISRRLDTLRYQVIKEALPAPQGPVPVDELKRFKKDHAEKLRRCRIHLEGKIAELAGDNDPERHTRLMRAMHQEIEDEVADLEKQMTKKKWIKVTMAAFGGVVATAAANAEKIAAADSPLTLGWAVGLTALGVSSQGYSLHELMKEPRFDGTHPMAYAVLGSQLPRRRR